MNVLFVNPNRTGQALIPLGLAYLSTYLKQRSHKTSLFDTHFSVRGSVEKDFQKRLLGFNPDIVGISCRELDFAEAMSLAAIARKRGKMVVWGGPHPTFAPNQAINTNGVETICLGEAEEAFVELVEKVSKGKDYFRTKNFWFKKKDGAIVRNGIRNLKENLDYLPLPDWGLFLKESKNFDVTFISSRGCPFHCTYCVNPVYQRLYAGKGKYVRLRSPDKLIEEIKHAVKKYNLKKVQFVDDAFTVSRPRVIEFAKKYKKEVNIPFWMITRADMIDFEAFKLLKDAGLQSVAMGVESGSHFIRNGVLKRNMKRETIIRAFKAARKLGIHTHSFNIVGAPYETEKTIWETINLNRVLKPSVVQFTILTPYMGTELREMLASKGLLLKGTAGDIYTETIIKNENLSVAQIEAWQKTMWLYVVAPKALYPAIHAVRKLLQYSPASFRRGTGEGFVLSAMVFGLYRRTGFLSTAKTVVKRLIGG